MNLDPDFFRSEPLMEDLMNQYEPPDRKGALPETPPFPPPYDFLQMAGACLR